MTSAAKRRTSMVIAVVKNGVIVPRDPLPTDWQEGMEVEVEMRSPNLASANGVHSADQWMDEVERCAAQQDSGDDMRLQQAIDEERRAAKELARKRDL
jgi:hypothetical protein